MAPPDTKDDSDKELGGLRSGSTTDIEAIRVPGQGGGRSESEDSDGHDHIEEDEKQTTTNNNTGGGLSLVKTLSRVLSRPESNFDPGPPPDGGARAWCTGMFFHPSPRTGYHTMSVWVSSHSLPIPLTHLYS